jgi:hypothetical protein
MFRLLKTLSVSLLQAAWMMLVFLCGLLVAWMIALLLSHFHTIPVLICLAVVLFVALAVIAYHYNRDTIDFYNIKYHIGTHLSILIKLSLYFLVFSCLFIAICYVVGLIVTAFAVHPWVSAACAVLTILVGVSAVQIIGAMLD